MQLNVEETLWGRSWVSSKHTHVSNCSHNSAILDYWAAAHARHDAAGGLQEGGVRDLEHQIPSVAVGAALENLHIVQPDVLAADVGEDLGRSLPDLPRLRRGQGLAGPPGPRAEDAEGGVGPEAPRRGLGLNRAPELSRLAAPAPFHALHRRLVAPAAVHGRADAPAVADAVAQGAEGPPVRVIVGHGADARDALPDIDPQPGAVGGGCGGEPDLLLPALPAQADRHRAPGPLQGIIQVLGRVHRPSVHGYDLVPDLHPRIPGRAAVALVEGRYRHGPLA